MRQAFLLLSLTAATLLAAGCGSTSPFKKKGDAEVAAAADTGKEKDKAKGKDDQTQATEDQPRNVSAQKSETAQDIDVSFLLSMSYAEAGAMAEQKMELPRGIKVAADKIEVLKTSKTGDPAKVRATGHVFVQVEDQLPYTALCQEALVSGDEIILRGKPVTQRGISMIEGLSDVTVFYMFGSQLRVIGRHKVSQVPVIARGGPDLDGGSGSGALAFRGHGNLPLPFADAGPWKAGSNPLLPPLDDDAVPASVRSQLRAAEAEAALQKSREGVPPAFPEEGQKKEKQG